MLPPDSRAGQTLRLDPALLREFQENGVHFATLEKLWQGGVKVDDLAGVIDLRERLAFRRDNGQLYAAPNVDLMAQAYRVVEGDMTLLEILVEAASEGIVPEGAYNRHQLELYNVVPRIDSGTINQALQRAIEQYTHPLTHDFELGPLD